MAKSENKKADQSEEQISEVEIINPSEVMGIDSAEVDLQISTAKKYPRDLAQVIADVRAMVTLDEKTAESCMYAVARADKEVTGPSVHLARIITQMYGNFRTVARVTEIGDKFLKAEGIAWDLQKNTANKVEVLRRITTKKGARYSEDMIMVSGNAACAIAFRNAVFNVIPRNITDMALTEARGLMEKKLSDPEKVLQSFKQTCNVMLNEYKVTEAEILKYLNRKGASEVKKSDIIKMRATYQAIKDGDTDVEQTFRPKVEKTVSKAEMPEKLAKNDTGIAQKLVELFEGHETPEKRDNTFFAVIRTYLKNACGTDTFTDVFKAFCETEGLKDYKTFTDFLAKAEVEKIVKFAESITAHA